MAMVRSQKTLDGEDKWLVFDIPYHDKYFEFSVWGTWTGTVTLQARSAKVTEEWIDVTTLTSPTERPQIEFSSAHGQEWRIGFKTGDFVDGAVTIDVRA